jgi:hypothetical protein
VLWTFIFSELRKLFLRIAERACELVKRILNGDIPDALKVHFVLKDHARSTQWLSCVVFPSIKTEYARLLLYGL